MAERKIKAMHRRFGICEGHICKECDHCISYVYDKRYYKCELYGNSNSEATDWRIGKQACGMFNREVELSRWTPVIEEIKHAPKPPEPPIRGQVSLFANPCLNCWGRVMEENELLQEGRHGRDEGFLPRV